MFRTFSELVLLVLPILIILLCLLGSTVFKDGYLRYDLHFHHAFAFALLLGEGDFRSPFQVRGPDQFRYP